MSSKTSIFIITIYTLCISTSCKKFLNEKYDKRQVIPAIYADLQAIMDENASMNQSYPSLLELVADNYYLTSQIWATRNVDDRENYIWEGDATYLQNWSTYVVVNNANVVLEQLSVITKRENNSNTYNDLRGQALFHRSFSFYSLAQLYCKPYNSSIASNELGIPMRLSSNVESKTTRETIQQTYDQIINDLKEASMLLPKTSIALSRPTKAAAFGVLSRTFLSMRDYLNAGKYADSALQISNSILDYNTLNSSVNAPIPSLNSEILFYADLSLSSTLSVSRAKIDSNLYNLYDTNDLRKAVFFKKNSDGTVGFKGSYDGTLVNYALFYGIATDEMLLTRAECYARNGNKDDALADLNTLLEKRWKTGAFSPITAIDANDALTKILAERRKELLYRGLRWPDLRRFNLEGANIALSRVINGTTYSLPPNDNRWVMLIPLQVINQTGMQQNPR